MTEKPYTKDDLLAEAARQHYGLTITPNPIEVGQSLAEYAPWAVSLDADSDAFDDVREEVRELISAAADLSRWAVKLGADRMVPDEQTLQIDGDDKPIVRVHFAFDPAMPQEARDSFVFLISQSVAANL